MKALSRRFWFVVFGIIVIVAVGSCCCLPLIPGIASPLYGVQIGNTQRGQYVKWKQPDFDNALDKVCANGGDYDLYVLMNDHSQRIHPYRPCKAPANIRTVKVTKSKVADNRAIGQSAANDPNVMHRVQSPVRDDIKKIVDALEQ
jgi:hypothetical protein